jgi:hypothetical protein
MSNVFTPDDGKKSDGIYILKDIHIAQLNAVVIAQHSPVTAYDELGFGAVNGRGVRSSIKQNSAVGMGMKLLIFK